ncbi:MAG: FapA family protein [Candidatus Cloacimonadaceae bacterium]
MNKILKNKSGNLILELRQESASAWLTIKRSGRLIDEQEILDLLDEAGIKTGFDEALEYIRRHSLEKEYDIPFPIALSHIQEGTAQIKLNYHFDKSLTEEKLKRLDLYELSQLSYTEAGSIIAQYSDNIFEREGSIYDIFGELIIPPEVDEDEAFALAGNNVSYLAREYAAEKSGYPYIDNKGRICILDSYICQVQDLPSLGAIRSPLALTLVGDLKGYNIAVANRLIVQGSLMDCSVFCEKDLVVEGEIIDCKHAGIQVLGSLQLRSASGSRLLVRQNLEFSGNIQDSELYIDGDIRGTTGESAILGGITQASGNIDIAIAGGKDQTELEIAISPFYRALLMQMTKEMVRLRQEDDEDAINSLQERIKRTEAELDSQLNLFLKRSPEEKRSITIREQVQANTVFRILKQFYHIKNPQKGISLLEKE